VVDVVVRAQFRVFLNTEFTEYAEKGTEREERKADPSLRSLRGSGLAG
jgi:hypothetical protein